MNKDIKKILCVSVSLCWMIILLTLLTACSKNDVVYDIGEYKVDLATVQNSNSNQAFLLDNHELLLNGGSAKSLETGQRVLLNYSYLEETSSGYDYVIKVNGIAAITQGQLSAVSPLTIDTMTNNPISLESVWVGNKYLNISFYMNYYSKKHAVSLITDKNKVNEKKISVYFRHDANNDAPGAMHKIIASFDLSNVLGDPIGAMPIAVNIYSDNYGEKDYELKY